VSVLAAALVSTLALSAEESPYETYLALIERSCAHPDDAFDGLSAWSLPMLETALKELRECEQRRSAGRAPPASETSPHPGGTCRDEPPPWAAAAILHTRYALASTTRAGGQTHLSLAARLLEQVGDEGFRRRWFRAAGLGFLHRRDIETARSCFEKGLERFGDDPALLVGLGSTYEVEEWKQRLVLRDPGSDPRSRMSKEERERTRWSRTTLLHAAGQYEKALSRDPGQPEALLRLGRAQLLLGRGDEGIASLQRVTEQAEDRDLVYLAHLFIGRERMRSGDLDAAIVSYHAALEADPRGQVALVATSHALHLGGDPIAAGELLEQRLTGPRSLPSDDSWWSYPESRPRLVRALLSRLRREACW
jgi:tetratricopeptide (TPR) repeat protein